MGIGRPATRDAGQATVELALVLPVVALVALVVVQVALVGRDLVLVVHAAREAARQAAVAPGTAAEAARTAATSTGLDPDRLRVDLEGRAGAGSRVTARVTYRSTTDVPLAGALLGDLDLTASAAMRVEE